MRVDLLVVDCEGGLVGGGLREWTCWWWTVRVDLLVVDCDGFFLLLVYCSFCAFSTSPMQRSTETRAFANVLTSTMMSSDQYINSTDTVALIRC